jgi:DNA-binding NarL/FixJ family response regulator
MQYQAERGGGPVRVLIADNSRIHAHLLAEALRRDTRLEVVGAACRSQEVLEAADRYQPVDIVVMSSQLDEEPLRGFEVLKKLRVACPEMRAIVLLDSSKKEVILEAFRAGARGVFHRHESLESLCKCVHCVHEGQIWANSEQMSFAVEALASAPTVRAVSASGMNLLSKRELEVVRSLAEGMTNREIAQRLGLSQHTIKNYLFRVFDKLGVSSRMELLFLTLNHPQGSLANPRDGNGQRQRRNGALKSGISELERAAEEGVPSAQLAVAEMYASGRGVTRDVVSAYMWYLVSERSMQGMHDAIDRAKRGLANLLSTEEILEAQKRAYERQKKAVGSDPMLPSKRRVGEPQALA